MANQSVQVSCRVRSAAEPGVASVAALSADPAHRTLIVHSQSGSSSSTVSPGTLFSCFDYVFPGSASQETLFECVGKPFVDDLLLGYNCTVLAYGQTGSGKTYTTVGGDSNSSDPSARGLVPRAMEEIFGGIARIDREQFDVALTASFIEVYQETLRDLLVVQHAGGVGDSKHLRIREEKGERGVFVDGALEILISSVASGMAVLARGNAQRATGSTLMNADSSRSHSVFTLTFTSRNITTRETVCGRLLFVDLAGSEKASKTAASGKRLDEAKHINRSLSALGNVINALTDGGKSSRFVPYRDSKLTRLLQSSLGGNAKTHLLLTCSSSELHIDETLSTLRFGARAKRIVNAPHVNNDKPTSAAEYKELLEKLQTKLESLYSYIRRLESSRCAKCTTQSEQHLQGRSCLSVSSICRKASAGGACEHSTCLEAARQGEETQIGATSGDPEVPVENERPMLASTECFDASASRSSDSGYRLLDALMQEEVNSLRRAIAQMQSGRYEAEHARIIADTMAQISRSEHNALCQAQLEKISALEAELTDVHTEISSLQQELAREQAEKRGLAATCEGLRGELRQLKLQQRRRDDEQSAEAEILRRQLHSFERQAQQSQAELLASQRQQEDLKASVFAKEQEMSRLGAEITALRSKSLLSPSPSTPTLGSPSASIAQRHSLPRPFTSVELGVSDPSGNSGMGTITNWWAGSPEQYSFESERESPHVDTVERSQRQKSLQYQLPSERRRTYSTPLAGIACIASGSESPLGMFPDPASSSSSNNSNNRAEERRCQSQGQSRPFRARLVGLLNSLEEETSSLKELVNESKREARHRPKEARVGGGGGGGVPGRQPHYLPCLET